VAHQRRAVAAKAGRSTTSACGGSWPTTAWPATAPAKRRSTTTRDSGQPPVLDLVGRRLRPAVLDHGWYGVLSDIPPGRAGCIWPS
jgi:hypothetical protein